MDNAIEEIDLMKLCSDCGILKMQTKFCFKKINPKFRKECIQCINIKHKI